MVWCTRFAARGSVGGVPARVGALCGPTRLHSRGRRGSVPFAHHGHTVMRLQCGQDRPLCSEGSSSTHHITQAPKRCTVCIGHTAKGRVAHICVYLDAGRGLSYTPVCSRRRCLRPVMGVHDASCIARHRDENAGLGLVMSVLGKVTSRQVSMCTETTDHQCKRAEEIFL